MSNYYLRRLEGEVAILRHDINCLDGIVELADTTAFGGCLPQGEYDDLRLQLSLWKELCELLERRYQRAVNAKKGEVK